MVANKLSLAKETDPTVSADESSCASQVNLPVQRKQAKVRQKVASTSCSCAGKSR